MSSSLEELKQIENRLAGLEQEKKALLEKRSALLGRVSNETTLKTITVPSNKHEKVQLFMSLFYGRQDVHAVRWENKQGRSGYSPACANEWHPRLCHKPKVKCGECNNRQLLPLDNKAVYDHLTGQKILGLYPLLNNDKCRLLAADFDKSDWKDAVAAFR